jgi:hypothetical protein
LKNHTHEVWACDFLQTYDLWFRTLFVFFIIELGSRRVIHFAVTYSPTDVWVAQQLREATPFDTRRRFLIRDNDRNYGAEFARAATGVEVLRTPIHAPKANAVCERFLGSVRRECLDHVLILNDRQLHRILKEYVRYFNVARPHQGLDGRRLMPIDSPSIRNKIIAFPVLNRLQYHEQPRISADRVGVALRQRGQGRTVRAIMQVAQIRRAEEALDFNSNLDRTLFCPQHPFGGKTTVHVLLAESQTQGIISHAPSIFEERIDDMLVVYIARGHSSSTLSVSRVSCMIWSVHDLLHHPVPQIA